MKYDIQLMVKFNKMELILLYSLQYLKQSDCIELRHIIQNFPAPEEESLLLTSFIDKLGGLDITNIEAEEDFKPLRIDWQRLQVRNILVFLLLEINYEF